ncbi:hypothetical protein DPX16_8719 [Anabarilius grahami]|uniref:Uncharacterized protein n=1 Tax=Anabarilius grahami TaxID=495550 RepID=A0A3N0YDJ9_ANAGA|nr:hypothetical protein DPX16_8719 [Anabarilius grahami]
MQARDDEPKSSKCLVCQANFGHRRCRREPTPLSAFVATSSPPLARPAGLTSDLTPSSSFCFNDSQTGAGMDSKGLCKT